MKLVLEKKRKKKNSFIAVKRLDGDKSVGFVVEDASCHFKKRCTGWYEYVKNRIESTEEIDITFTCERIKETTSRVAWIGVKHARKITE